MTDHVTDINVGKMTIEEAKELLLELQCETIKQDSDEMDVKNFEALNMAIEALQFQQSVVRCGECQYYDTEKGWVGGYCWMCHHDPSDVDIEWERDEFCSKGKRKGVK